jgi:hypothetical protein
VNFSGDTRAELEAGCERVVPRIAYEPLRIRVQTNFVSNPVYLFHHGKWWRPGDGICAGIVRFALQGKENP